MEHQIPENDQAWTAEGDSPREGTGAVPSRREQAGLPFPAGGTTAILLRPRTAGSARPMALLLMAALRVREPGTTAPAQEPGTTAGVPSH